MTNGIVGQESRVKYSTYGYSHIDCVDDPNRCTTIYLDFTNKICGKCGNRLPDSDVVILKLVFNWKHSYNDWYVIDHT